MNDKTKNILIVLGILIFIGGYSALSARKDYTWGPRVIEHWRKAGYTVVCTNLVNLIEPTRPWQFFHQPIWQVIFAERTGVQVLAEGHLTCGVLVAQHEDYKHTKESRFLLFYNPDHNELSTSPCDIMWTPKGDIHYEPVKSNSVEDILARWMVVHKPIE